MFSRSGTTMITNRTAHILCTLNVNFEEDEIREPKLIGMIKHFHIVDKNTNLLAVLGMAAIYDHTAISIETH